MSIVTADIPEKMHKRMERLIQQGHYKSRSDFIRDAIRKNLLIYGKAREDIMPRGDVKDPVKNIGSLFKPNKERDIEKLLEIVESEVFG